MATTTLCSTYQEFAEVLLWVEGFEKAPDDSDEEEEKGSSRFHWQRNPNSLAAPLRRRCNNRHFGECRQGSSGCFTCGQMGHRAHQCPQNQQKPQPHALPPTVPLQQIQGISSYTPTGYAGAYHYQRDGGYAPYTLYQAVDHSGTLEDHLRTLMLLLVVLVRRVYLINLVKDEVIREIETECYLGHKSEETIEERMSGLSSSCGAELGYFYSCG
ncbi:hypothetical protein D8674_025825 [Pyrus ussuriensis x Pyrus communis]|uniref:CCHC-type domain-containing protein n=1 Tax=Pyrus ussuriensis x Pyrus communis TaxID=2448454 RepID=A0A5N5I9N8_9ROSA|nr:hypothetical protein D8674_025825 [Pyrus ussuriensis x Pyrus communis]